MSDVILVVLEHPEAAAHLLHAAECLAVLTGGARVNVLAIRTPPGYATLTAEANLTGGLLDALAEEEAEAEAAAERARRGSDPYGRGPDQYGPTAVVRAIPLNTPGVWPTVKADKS